MAERKHKDDKKKLQAGNNLAASWEKMKLFPQNSSYTLELVVDNKIFSDEEGKQFLMPDACLRSGEHIICIEADNRTEKLEHKTFNVNNGTSLKDKFQKYVKLAGLHPQFKFVVFFVIADGSITLLNYKSNCSERIANVKEHLQGVQGILASNLEIYVTSLKRSAAVLQQFLQKICKPNVVKVKGSTIYKALGYDVVELRTDEDFKRHNFIQTKFNYTPDEWLYVCKNLANGTSVARIVLSLQMLEGTFRSQEELAYFVDLLKAGKLPRDIELIILYNYGDGETSIREDILRSDLKTALKDENVRKRIWVWSKGIKALTHYEL